jgi:hypothetical protein
VSKGFNLSMTKEYVHCYLRSAINSSCNWLGEHQFILFPWEKYLRWRLLFTKLQSSSLHKIFWNILKCVTIGIVGFDFDPSCLISLERGGSLFHLHLQMVCRLKTTSLNRRCTRCWKLH